MATEGATGLPDSILECHGLRKSFGDRVAVDGVGFRIGPSETYGLLGPNGAGKTTTISMICGLLVRDAGTVTVAGRPIDIDEADAKAAIGYVPQEIAIYPDLTARENLRFFGQLYGLRDAELKRRVDEVLDTIELTDRGNDRTDQFSGGMKRRLNIGIGLLHRPRLLVLDEPTVGRRSAEPERDPLQRRGARAAGDGDPLHHSLHGGGGAPLRQGRHHRQRAYRGRGDASGARQPHR